MSVQYKTNKVKVDLASYIHYWRGIKKIGKTTFFRDLISTLYDGELSRGLLISCGNEQGFETLDELTYILAETWDDLDEIVEDLIDNKEKNKFEFLCFDTVDELIKMAQKEVIRQHKRAKPESGNIGFNGCFGGYGEPKRRLTDLVDNIITKLQRSGYGIICIGHTKVKDITEKDGTQYQLLTSNLTSDYDLIFSAKADINAIFNTEKEINSEKHITDTKRYIWLRGDGFVDAGCRFVSIPDKIELDAKKYVSTIEEAIKHSLKKPISNKELSEQKKKEKAEKEAFHKANKLNLLATPEKLAEELKELFKQVKTEQRSEASKKLKELELDSKVLTNNTPEKLKQMIEFIKSLNK